MDPKDATTRHDQISGRQDIEAVDIDAGALTKIIYQADQQPAAKGWGKLVGYYTPGDKTLLIKDSFALQMPRNEERIRRDPIEDVLGYKYRRTKYKYRYVGFYIISDDGNVHTHSIVNYFLNADDIKGPKVFLVFSAADARMGRSPWRLYDLDESVNRRTVGVVLRDAYAYELDYAKFEQVDVGRDSLFRRLEFSVSKSPVFEFFADKYSGLERGEARSDAQSKMECLTDNFEDNVSQAVENLNDLLNNKKKGKSSAKVNYLGAMIRHREMMESKEQWLADLRNKMEVIRNINK